MRLDEFAPKEKGSSNPEFALITALELLQHRYQDQEIAPKISTNALIKLVLNTDRNFDYDALVAANNNPAVKNLIKSFNRTEVFLNPLDGATTDVTNPGDVPAGLNTVADMAKKAAKKRGAPVA